VFLAHVQCQENGESIIPWNDISQLPANYYDIEAFTFPVKIQDPAQMSLPDLYMLIDYLSKLNKPFSFRGDDIDRQPSESLILDSVASNESTNESIIGECIILSEHCTTNHPIQTMLQLTMKMKLSHRWHYQAAARHIHHQKIDCHHRKINRHHQKIDRHQQKINQDDQLGCESALWTMSVPQEPVVSSGSGRQRCSLKNRLRRPRQTRSINSGESRLYSTSKRNASISTLNSHRFYTYKDCEGNEVDSDGNPIDADR